MTTEVIQNCRTCGTGRSWWFRKPFGGYECPNCEGDPLKAGSGNADWRIRSRQKMVEQFGVRMAGDELLMDTGEAGRSRYAEWVKANPEIAPWGMKA